MFKVAIVEDEESARDNLCECLDQYSKEFNVSFEKTIYCDAEKFLTDFHMQFDVVFMDIEMPCIDGIRAARRLRQMDSYVGLVFITNLARYAINGYEVDALDYILKPLKYGSFKLKIRKILNYCSRNSKKMITISTRGQKKVICVDDILYVEISGHSIVYHMIYGLENAYGTLSEVQSQLQDDWFELCNRCFLVNLKHVKKIEGLTAIVGNEELLISRARKAQFVEALDKYLQIGNNGRGGF